MFSSLPTPRDVAPISADTEQEHDGIEVDSTAYAHTDLDIYGSRILIVDDEPVNLLLLERTLKRAGYSRLVSTLDSLQVASLCQYEPPDMVLLDLMMPKRDGFEILNDLAPLRNQYNLPVLVLTADSTSNTRCRALASGAKDFLTKPLNGTEVLLRVHNLLETTHLQRRLSQQNSQLEMRVRERTAELEKANEILERSQAELKSARIEVLERLAQAAEFRDDDTGRHTQRVGETAARIAEELGWKPARIELLRLAAPLHDVGKIGIPDSILLKTGKLTEEEFSIVKQHTTIGAQLLKEGRSALIHIAQSIALNHHERFDGKGYPRQLVGESIPLEGRIVAVADVFDALTHERPYKAAWSVEEARAEIEKGAGTQFDPHIVQAFLRLPF